jgi:hypothetical protein
MTKREHVPPGYDVRLDRRQPPPLGCAKIFVGFLILLVALVPLGWGVVTLLAQQQRSTVAIPTVALLPSATVPPVTPTATASLTPDEWAIYGTQLAIATASPTMDYCWWLTPSPVPTATPIYTPDAWQLRGTEIYLAEHPAQPPTLAPARELCTSFPTWEPTAIFTPYPLPELRSGQSQLDAVQATVAAAFAGPTATPESFIINAPPVREIYRDVYIIVTATPSTP